MLQHLEILRIENVSPDYSRTVQAYQQPKNPAKPSTPTRTRSWRELEIITLSSIDPPCKHSMWNALSHASGTVQQPKHEEGKLLLLHLLSEI